MRSFSYLITRKLKNNIIDIFKRPSKFFTALILSFLIAFQFIFGELESTGGGFNQRDISELYAILLAVYAFVFFLTSYTGFSRGSSMFGMQDVNLLFLSPTKQKSILTYGLTQGLTQAIVTGFFIMFQYTWMHDTYQINRLDLAYIMLGYGLTVFVAQMLAMMIYSFTCNDDKKKKIVKGVYLFVLAVIGVYFFSIITANSNDALSLLVQKANSSFSNFIPFIGLIRLGVVGMMQLDLIKFGIFAVGMILLIWLYYFIISKVEFDFYEDVLFSTEISHSAIMSRREGKVYEPLPKVVNLGKVGFKKGMGASVIAQKQKIERRRKKIFFLDYNSIFNIVIITAFGLVSDDFITLMILSIYTMLMFSANSAWVKELSLPYVYLMPQRPFIKLFYAIKKQFGVIIKESIVMFLPLFFIYRIGFTEFLTAIPLRITFGFLFVGLSLFIKRFFGITKSTPVSSIIYFILSVLLCAPTILYGVILYNMFEYTFLSAVFAVAKLNIVFTIGLIFISRNILKYVDYN